MADSILTRFYKEWGSKRSLQWVVFTLLILLLAIYWGRRILIDPDTESHLVICKSCKFRQERTLVPAQIAEVKCTKCGGPVGFAWKCSGCDYEFPLVLKKIEPGTKTREEIRQQRFLEWKCPNCGGADCGPLVILK
jgi:phage FluMu protein Com